MKINKQPQNIQIKKNYMVVEKSFISKKSRINLKIITLTYKSSIKILMTSYKDECLGKCINLFINPQNIL